MREIITEDLYLLSRIADKMNFVLPDPPSKKGKTKEEVEVLHQKYGAELMTTLFRKMHLAKDEINELITNISGKNANEMNIKEIKEVLSTLISKDGIFDFFR
jgi:predicted unusual protein kinase regulating ubiquinone biosynthesis (AarF/ABC1/UbiB family)